MIDPTTITFGKPTSVEVPVFTILRASNGYRPCLTAADEIVFVGPICIDEVVAESYKEELLHETL